MRIVLRLSLLLLTVLAFGLPAARPAGAQEADLQLVKLDSPDPVPPGGTITYDIILTNSGPDAADFVSVFETLPAGTTFVALISEPGWSCTTPPVGSGGDVDCSSASLAADGSAAFTLIVMVDAGVAPGTVITNTATASAETPDPDEGGPSASTETTVATPPPTTDVSVAKVDDPDPVLPGANLVYTITVTNSGQANATSVNLVDPLPPETTFVSLVEPAGWSCITPAVGTNDAVLCSIASLAPGSAVFTLTVAVGSGVVPGTAILNTATVSSANDSDESNNNGNASTTVTGSADLSVTKADAPDPVMAGTNLTYTITVTNAGPHNAAVSLSDPLPAETTFVSLSAPAGWSCTTPAVGSGGMVSCSTGSLGLESAVFTLTVAVDPGTPAGTLSNTATASSAASDPNPDDNDGSASTTVSVPATLSGTKTVTSTFTPGGAVTYTVVLTNSGTLPQMDNPGSEFTDVLPPSLTLVSASATSGTATVAINTVTWNGSLAGGASVTITINATINPGVADGTTISNQGTIAYDADSDGINEASAVTDDPATEPQNDPTSFQVGAQPVPEIPALDGVGLALLAALLAIGGAWTMRRQRNA